MTALMYTCIKYIYNITFFSLTDQPLLVMILKFIYIVYYIIVPLPTMERWPPRSRRCSSCWWSSSSAGRWAWWWCTRWWRRRWRPGWCSRGCTRCPETVRPSPPSSSPCWIWSAALSGCQRLVWTPSRRRILGSSSEKKTMRARSVRIHQNHWYVTLEHGRSHTQHQQYSVWVKIIHFSVMTKIIRILRSCSMKIFSKFTTLNISKLNFWL